MNLKTFLNGKRYGFWVTTALFFLGLLTAIIYIATFTGTEEISYYAFAFLLAGVVISAILIALKKDTIASYVLGGFNFISFLFYVYGVYYYFFNFLLGIDVTELSAAFIICTILFVAITIAGIVNVFLPQDKQEVKEVEMKTEEGC